MATAREARAEKQAQRIAAHHEKHETLDAYALAAATAAKKAAEEEEAKAREAAAAAARLHALSVAASGRSPDSDAFLAAELADVRRRVPPSELRACSIDTVAVELAPTAAKQLLLRFVFPALYPAEPAVVELSSKALSSELIVKLGEAAGRLAAKHGGGRQVLHVVDWLRASLTTNRLAPAYDDLKALAKLFERHTSSRLVEANERTGEVQVHLAEGLYVMDVRLRLDQEYPRGGGLTLDLAAPPAAASGGGGGGCNLPPELSTSFLATARDLVARLAEPPQRTAAMQVGRDGAGTGGDDPAHAKKKKGGGAQQQMLESRKKEAVLKEEAEAHRRQAEAAHAAAVASFVPQPSLAPVVTYLLERCLQPVAGGRCAVCEKRLLPAQPENAPKVPRDLLLLRLAGCGCMYHHRCIEAYVSSPPFGKGCKVCGQRVSHHKLVTDPRVLEARWAAEQARKREIQDAADLFAL